MEIELYWQKKSAYGKRIGNSKTEMAFMNSNMEQVHQFVHCREFLTEVLFGWMTTTRIEMNGFEYGYIDRPLIANKTRIIMRNRSLSKTTFMFDMRRGLNYINMLEDFLALRKSTIIPAKIDGENYYIVEGSKFWMLNPYFLDIYLMFLKLGEVVVAAKDYFGFCLEVGALRINGRDIKFLHTYAKQLRVIFAKRKDVFGEEYDWAAPFESKNFYTRRNVISLLRGNVEDPNINMKLLNFITR